MGHTAELVPLGRDRVADRRTGEILDLHDRPGMMVFVPGRPKWGEGWFMAIQDAFVALAKDKELRGRPMSVLTYMMGRLNWENWIMLPQTEIAEELDLHRSHVSAAIKLLVERGIIQEGPKSGRSHSYRLNSTYGWKGKTVALRKRRGEEIIPHQIGFDGELYPHQNPN